MLLLKQGQTPVILFVHTKDDNYDYKCSGSEKNEVHSSYKNNYTEEQYLGVHQNPPNFKELDYLKWQVTTPVHDYNKQNKSRC